MSRAEADTMPKSRKDAGDISPPYSTAGGVHTRVITDLRVAGVWASV